MNTIRSRGIMLNTLVRDCPVFMVLLWAILNATHVAVCGHNGTSCVQTTKADFSTAK